MSRRSDGEGLAAGTAVAGYRLAQLLGAGGMGQVYLAFSPSGDPVAVKVVRPELACQSSFRMRFAREVAMIAAVRGTCTANLIDADPDGDPPWAAMQYVPGMTLANYVERYGPLHVDQVRLLAWALAVACNDIHGAGLVHRDLKPANVILSPTGPKVLDFGIARAKDATSLTEAGERPGSIAWMAPEQVLGDADSPATDVHAWGGLVYFAATGRSPFGSGPPEALAWRVVNVEPDISELPSSVANLRPLIGSALSADPRARPTTGELIRGTRLEPDPERTTVTGRTDIDGALAAYWNIAEDSLDTGRQALLVENRRRARRMRWRLPVAGAIAAVVAATALTGWAMSGQPTTSTQPPPSASLSAVAPASATPSTPASTAVLNLVVPAPAGTRWEPAGRGMWRTSATSPGFAVLIRKAFEAKELSADGASKQMTSPGGGTYWIHCAPVAEGAGVRCLEEADNSEDADAGVLLASPAE